MIKTHYSCLELAEMKLPGLPGSERGLRTWLAKRDWSKKETPARGKNGFKIEYQPPKEIMDIIRGQLINTAIQSGAPVKKTIYSSRNNR